jgi:hypothetical protein
VCDKKFLRRQQIILHWEKGESGQQLQKQLPFQSFTLKEWDEKGIGGEVEAFGVLYFVAISWSFVHFSLPPSL